MDMEKKSPLRDVMNSTMEKVREMVDANNIVGAPITTPDGVTLIPISRVSFGFGSGGGDYGKPGQNNFGGGGGAGVKIDPVAFLGIKDGTTQAYGGQGRRFRRRQWCRRGHCAGGFPRGEGRLCTSAARGGAAGVHRGPHCGYGTGYCRQDRKIFR